MSAHSSSRRNFVSVLAGAPVILVLADAFPARAQEQAEGAPPASAEPGAPMCEDIDLDGMRFSLNYVEPSPFGNERNCLNCKLWGSGAEAPCGACTLIQGSISPTAYCDSWAPIEAPAQGGA